MKIKRIGVKSLAKISAALNAFGGFVFGLILTTVSIFAGGTDSFGLLFGIGSVVAFPVIYGLLGLVMGALGAVVYNTVSGIVGGIEFETE